MGNQHNEKQKCWLLDKNAGYYTYLPPELHLEG